MVIEVGVEPPEVDIREDRLVVIVVEVDEFAHVVADDLMGMGRGGGAGRWRGTAGVGKE